VALKRLSALILIPLTFLITACGSQTSAPEQPYDPVEMTVNSTCNRFEAKFKAVQLAQTVPTIDAANLNGDITQSNGFIYTTWTIKGDLSNSAEAHTITIRWKGTRHSPWKGTVPLPARSC
jgi:hypothetical protein